MGGGNLRRLGLDLGADALRLRLSASDLGVQLADALSPLAAGTVSAIPRRQRHQTAPADAAIAARRRGAAVNLWRLRSILHYLRG